MTWQAMSLTFKITENCFDYLVAEYCFAKRNDTKQKIQKQVQFFIFETIQNP